MDNKVLVVEDDEDLGEALCRVLERDGYDVRRATSALDGIARVTEDGFGLVLLDEDLEELSGGAVLRVLSDLAVRTPVFVMSARPSGWQNDAFRHGATACLRKPFDVRRLLELIDAFYRAATRTAWPGDVRQLSGDDLRRLARLSREEIDALPFGAIRLDAAGRIDRFNRFEGDAAGYFPPSVLGAKFSDIAPCSAVKEFAAAIEAGYATGLDSVLRFVFPHHGARTVVSVRVHGDPETRRVWIFVSKARGEVAPALSEAALGDALVGFR